MPDKIPFYYYMSKACDLERDILRLSMRNVHDKEALDRVYAFTKYVQQCPRLTLKSGANASVSIQASEHHYCTPRQKLEYKDYTHFELGFPSLAYFSDLLLRPYSDTNHGEPTGIYINVPTEVVQEYVDTLCGIRGFISMFDQKEYPLVLTDEDISYYSLL